MDDEQLFELYRIIKRGYNNSCWDTIQESLDFVSEYLEIEEDENLED
jgi:hypothetical protein